MKEFDILKVLFYYYENNKRLVSRHMTDYSWIQASGLRREFQSLERDANRAGEYLSQHKEFMYRNCKPHDIDPIFWDFMHKGCITKDCFDNAKEIALHLSKLFDLDAVISIVRRGDSVYFSIGIPDLGITNRSYLMDIIKARMMIDGNYPTANDIPNLSQGAQRHVRENKLESTIYNKNTYLVRKISEGNTFIAVKNKFKNTLPKRYFDFPQNDSSMN